jgi:hypothetical protein
MGSDLMRDGLEEGWSTFTWKTNLEASGLRIEHAGPSVSILNVIVSEYGRLEEDSTSVRSSKVILYDLYRPRLLSVSTM